ncbi:hypothetical protein AB0910_16755 [Streptomyces sp. NPDC047002]|uniref:hypothetical protein n=1 Tax=Streptomyces sp. NPDC047002 TaxID=3155475 RepID=UPI003451A06D
MPARHSEPALPGAPPGREEAEAVLVEHYPRLVRLAYLALPPALGRHRRVLAAHRVVQRALPRGRGGRGCGRDEAYAWVRGQVLAAALAAERSPRLRARAGLLPFVAGIRLFPRAGGGDELGLDRALSGVGAAARAALALRVLEGLPPAAVSALLAAAGAAAPDEAVRMAGRLAAEQHGRAETLLGSGEFDPCTVQTRPTDLLRRGRRRRLAGAAVACAAAGVVLAAVLPARGTHPPAPAAGPAGSAEGGASLDPRQVVRAPGDAWSHASRVDFTVWPARGARDHDTALIGRALAAWGGAGSGPAGRVAVTATPGTAATPPDRSPQLLYAGDADRAAVVLLYDGARVARYAEPVSGGGAAALDVARADDGDVTTAAALAVSRTAGSARYLLAPWVAEATGRDLLRPDSPARAVRVGGDGLTDPVRGPAPGGPCGAWPVLQLRSSQRIAERHAFLLADLGDLSPVHLTYTPPPAAGVPARSPREATSGPALVSWARTACTLQELRGAGVKAVNNWAFAQQDMPEHRGRATWVCSRADTWSGPGRVMVQLQQPSSSDTAPGTFAGKARNTSACSRFGQNVVAGVRWRSPAGHSYLLAAGSRAVTSISTSGGVRASAGARTLAVRDPAAGSVRLTARLSTGGTLQGVAPVEPVP